MKVYVAAPYMLRDLLRRELSVLEVEHTSSWLLDTHEINEGTVDTAPAMDHDYAFNHSVDDFADIDRADAFILISSWYATCLGLTLAQTSSGGRHVETGYALAKGKPVWVVGKPENIFHRGLCVVVPFLETAIKEIRNADNA